MWRIIVYSLIAAGVTFVMGRNVGRDRINKKKSFHKKAFANNNNNNINSNMNGNGKPSPNELEPQYFTSQVRDL